MDSTTIQNIQTTITSYIQDADLQINEGSASIKELQSLYEYASQTEVKSVAEIGFNAGFSSYIFLASNPGVTVTSFDIGDHPYVQVAKQLIDSHFPGRHTLIIGDSTITVPEFSQNQQGLFDLLFIDGGHSYNVAKQDLLNMKLLAKPTTKVIMDDLVPWLPWGFGPFMAWQYARYSKLLIQNEFHADGSLYPRRAWGVGTYSL